MPRLPGAPTEDDLRKAAPSILSLARQGMDTVLSRYGRDSSYPWIDTKFSTVDGRDFSESDPVRGKDIVYSWIQGRGLEAVAEHYRYFIQHKVFAHGSEEAVRCRELLLRVSHALRAARAAGSGHLYFSMSQEGYPRLPSAAGGGSVSTLSDIFCSRGLFAAARVLKDDVSSAESKAYCLSVYDDVLRGEYASDQISFDPKNPVVPVPGRVSHAHYMLLIPTMRLLLREEDAGFAERGLFCIRHILSRHVSSGAEGKLEAGDFIEFIDNEDRPFRSGGRILNDPGHALEFVGLAAGFLRAHEESRKAGHGSFASIKGSLLRVFAQNFKNGFDAPMGGIRKLRDLETGEAVNSDMPWWSLPETMRSALECREISRSETEREFFLSAFASCWNAFLENYFTEAGGGLCIQTRDGEGRISNAVPAVPDADPGYHTGLSLLGCLDIIEGF